MQEASPSTPDPIVDLPAEYSWLEGGQSYIVCGFYTPNYLPQILNLKASLEALGINHFIKCYEPVGGWEANTRLKPVFVDYCLHKFPDHNVVYLDADAVVRKVPAAFENMTTDLMMLFHPIWQGRRFLMRASGKYFLRISAGTIAVRNSPGGRKFAALWKSGEADAKMTTVDEDMIYMAFHHLAGLTITVLPFDYAKVFDAPGSNATIEHYQASRGQFKIRKTMRRTRQLAAWAVGGAALAYLAWRLYSGS